MKALSLLPNQMLSKGNNNIHNIITVNNYIYHDVDIYNDNDFDD